MKDAIGFAIQKNVIIQVSKLFRFVYVLCISYYKRHWHQCLTHLDAIFDLYYLSSTFLECPKNHFICKNKKCIHKNKLCDGANDCDDNSDEIVGCEGNWKFNVYMYFMG